MIVVKISNGEVSVINDFAKQKKSVLKSLYKEIQCRCVDCVCRKIGGKYFDIWVDDEGLIKEGTKNINAISINGGEILVGNLIIANFDKNGKTIGLTEKDVKLIKDNIFSTMNLFGKEKANVMVKGYESYGYFSLEGVCLTYEY